MNPERRKHKRIRLTGKLKPIPATFKTESVLQVLGTSAKHGEGHIRSLSREGLFIATETVPTVGEFVTVIFSDRSCSKIEVCGTVRSTSAEQGLVPARKRMWLGNWPDSGFGMQLKSLTDEYQEFYEELLTP